MGGHYGSVQLRTEDRKRVKAAATTVARKRGIKCLIGPALDGWVGVYPEMHGNDTDVGEDIARIVGGEAIHLLVHDDSIFVYFHWRDGNEIASFHSAPGYFGDADLAKETAMAGKPDELAHLAGSRLNELRAILSREHPDFGMEYERLGRFGELLGIQNAVAAYEYLKGGETDNITRWTEFEEVPEDVLREEQAAALAHKQQVDNESQSLMSTGLLLHETYDSKSKPIFCATTGGFLVAWTDHRDEQTLRFEMLGPPWNDPIDPKLGVKGHLFQISADATGERVAIALGTQAVVLEGAPWRIKTEFSESSWVTHAALIATGERLAYSSNRKIVVTEIESRKRLATWDATNADVSLHPSGQWIARGGNGLGIAAVEEGSTFREFVIEGRPMWPAGAREAVGQKVAAFDFTVIEVQFRKALNRHIETVAAQGNPMSEAEISEFLAENEKNFEKTKRELQDVGSLPAPQMVGLQPSGIGFSRDGSRLWFGTPAGLRVYRWETVLNARGNEMPEPEFAFDPGVVDRSGQSISRVYDVAEEPGCAGLVFGGLRTGLCRFDLTTRKVRCLLEMPPNTAVVELAFSGDALAIFTQTMPELTGKRIASHKDNWGLRIWSYSRLLDRS